MYHVQELYCYWSEMFIFVLKSLNSFCVVVLCLSVNHPYIYSFMMTKISKLQPGKMDEVVTRVGEETNV